MARRRLPPWRRWALGAGGLAVLALGACVIWVVHLDRVVTKEFQGRHWSVPARVFAAPLELYAGAPVTPDELEDELHRLHYRSGDPAAGPGLYKRTGSTFDLHARRVRFIDELREPQQLTIRMDKSAVIGLKQGNGADLPVFRLDPPWWAACFPSMARIGSWFRPPACRRC